MELTKFEITDSKLEVCQWLDRGVETGAKETHADWRSTRIGTFLA